MNTRPEQGLRRAALAVHAMAPEDRDWLLRELAQAQRGRLQPLLAELSGIGIPRDPVMLQDAARFRQPVAPRAMNSGDDRPLAAEAARSLAAWLDAQPAQAAARLLASAPAWRPPLLAALPGARRAELQETIRDLRQAPELDRFVLAAAHRYLAAHPGSSRLARARTTALRLLGREQVR